MVELCLQVGIYDDFLFQIYLVRLAFMSRICVHRQLRLVIACASCFSHLIWQFDICTTSCSFAHFHQLLYAMFYCSQSYQGFHKQIQDEFSFLIITTLQPWRIDHFPQMGHNIINEGKVIILNIEWIKIVTNIYIIVCAYIHTYIKICGYGI